MQSGRRVGTHLTSGMQSAYNETAPGVQSEGKTAHLCLLSKVLAGNHHAIIMQSARTQRQSDPPVPSLQRSAADHRCSYQPLWRRSRPTRSPGRYCRRLRRHCTPAPADAYLRDSASLCTRSLRARGSWEAISRNQHALVRNPTMPGMNLDERGNQSQSACTRSQSNHAPACTW